MPLSVKDGMGAWIKDFQDSNAPQFKGKSDKERREMAMAAYLSAKRGDKNEATDNPPFTPDPPKPAAKNSDNTKTSPMSRAKQLAKMARDRGVKKESVELDEMFASTTEPHKDGHRPKVVKTQPNGKTTMSYLGQHVYKSKEHARNAADHIAKGMRKGRASDSYIDDFARRHHKEHGMKESVEHLDEAHAYAKAAKALHDYGTKNGGIDKKDFHAAAKHLDNVGKAGLMQKGTHLAKFNNHIKGLDTDVRDRIHMTLKQHGVMESVEEAGSPERYRMIKKAGDKYNKEKKKAERDAKRAMSKDKDMMGENNSAPQSAAHRRAQMGSRYSDLQKKVKLKGFGPDAAKGNMGNPAARAALKPKNEETVSELKKSTLGSYVNKASKDAASKAYGAASAAKDNRADQSGKDFAKSMKRLRGINTATKKLAKEDTNEAKSFDQKFRDHLKFATSKSKAVQDYMKKRVADRDAMNKKNDPNAAKKGYALSAVPPERAFKKARKKGMSASDASQAVGTASRNRGRKLPEGKLEEAVQYKVDIDGLPPTFMQGRSAAEILSQLRKIVKQPSMIKGVERHTDMEVRRAYRKKSMGREMDEAVDPSDTGGKEEASMAMRQIKAMEHFLEGIEERVENTGDMEEWYQNKLTKAHDYLKTLYSYGKGDDSDDDDDMNESIQVDEISADLAKRYHKKATAPGATKPASDLGHTKDSMRKTHNRVVGSNRAMDRMFRRDKTYKK